jgi:GT2 family glycosyltransferase
MSGLYGVYVPEAIAYHLGSATLGHRRHPRIVYLLTRNQFLLVLKNYPTAALLHLLPQILIFQFLWLGLTVRRGWVRPYLQGVLSALRCLPRIMRRRATLKEIRRITDSEFIAALRTSEKQVSEWQRSLRAPDSPSKMLRIYFWLFRG